MVVGWGWGVVVNTLTVTIPPGLWLTSNRHSTNRGHRARIVTDLHTLAASAARAARLSPIVGPVAVDWTIHYPRGVRRDKGDASNAQPTTKALLDGLVPKWLEDDGPLHVVAETFRRGPNLLVPQLHEICVVLTSQAVPF